MGQLQRWSREEEGCCKAYPDGKVSFLSSHRHENSRTEFGNSISKKCPNASFLIVIKNIKMSRRHISVRECDKKNEVPERFVSGLVLAGCVGRDLLTWTRPERRCGAGSTLLETSINQIFPEIGSGQVSRSLMSLCESGHDQD
jgi:hypothetical protein